MTNILIVYSTTDGHTKRICERIKQVAEVGNNKVSLRCIDDQPDLPVDACDKIVVGASIRYGKYRPQVYAFVKKNQQQLEQRPNAFFSVNVVARKAEKSQPGTNPYVQKFLKQIAWKPVKLEVFAGKIDYPRYPFWDRQIIRFIMWLTNGPTDPGSTTDFTDWEKVDAFGHAIADM